jgi:alpha-amylase
MYSPNPARLRRAVLVATTALATTLAFADDVILQYYESKWETIEKKLPDVFMAGYTAFWFPPPYKADTGGYSVGYDVFDRFNLGKPFDQTLYGTEESVKQLNKVAHRAGFRAYYDWIPNHNGFRDSSTSGFVASGDYPGFVTTLPGDVDGDFHGAYASGDQDMRLAGLIDIAQEKNHQFIRQPAVAGAQNIPNETPDPNNARFYPDLSLPTNIYGVHPFNLATPLAGDPVSENATGLLLRNAQWMLEVVGADGFRIDAIKHLPDWFFNNFYDYTVYQRGPKDLAGNPTTPFAFGEALTGDFGILGAYRRKDSLGNRDVLDFPLFFAMNDVLNGGGFGDMRNLENASVDAIDGNANDGSAGVQFVSSHDNGAPAMDNLGYAHILTRAGYPLVYFNAQEFGTNRDFPRGGRGDALGGDYGNLVPRLVDVSRRYAKGTHKTRSIDSDVYVYERSNSLLVGLSDRGDAGFDSRTVQTDFSNVTLTELSGAASDPVVNANGDYPQTISVPANGIVTIKVPRNKTNTTTHNKGFIMYGLATPTHTHTLTNVSSILPSESNSVPNGSRRLTPLQVITANNFSVNVQTSATIPEDNALVRVDGGRPLHGATAQITSGEFAGFEQFTSASPRATSGSGNYSINVDTTTMSEGLHFVETVAFLPRPGGSPAAYSIQRSAIYLDRTSPTVQLAFPSTTGTSDVLSQSYGVVAKSADMTANSMHIFFDQPSNYNFLGNVSGINQMTKVDRGEFRYTWNNITGGTHSITIVAFEQTGRSSVTRFEPIQAIIPQPSMTFNIDTDNSVSSENIQALPGTISSNAYGNDFVIRVDKTGGLNFPANFTVSLDVDGVTYNAVAYNASLLPPVNRLVQNDQNLADQYDEFRFVWRGYTTGVHSLTARAALTNGSSPANSVPALITVPDTVTGPGIFIQSPTAGTVYNTPTSVTVNTSIGFNARSVQAYLSQPGGTTPYQLLQGVNLPASTNQTLQSAVSNYLASDNLSGINVSNGVYTIRAVASTGLDGGGIASEASTTISITGFPNASQTTTPLIDGNISEFFDRTPLAVSAADGAGLAPTPADFGADGSLTELHARVANNILYLAVRGDMFDGTDENNNATIVYIDVDSTSSTGAKHFHTTSDLSDTANALRSRVKNSGFDTTTSLIAQGIGFDAAVVIDGANPVSARLFGFGSGGVAGSTSNFAELSGSIAYGRGLGAYPGASGTTIAGPSGFEVAIPLSQLANANPRGMAFVAVTTSDTGFPSPNTLPENPENAFNALQYITAVAKFPTQPALVINEVNNGAKDWVELYNPTGSAVNLGQWSLRWNDGAGVSAQLPLTGATSGAGSYLVVSDQALSPAPPSGSITLGSNIPWNPVRAGSATLVDPYGLALDYVRWDSTTGQNSVDSAPAGTIFSGNAHNHDGSVNQSLARNPSSSDTNQASDFAVRAPSSGAVNPLTTSIGDWMEYR